MKTRLVLAGMLVMALLATMGCSGSTQPAPGQKTVEKSYDDLLSKKHFVEQTQLNAGDVLVVTLASSPGTGYKWSEQAQIGDQTVIKQAGHEFVAPSNNVPGAAGKETWKFQSLKAGSSTIILEYGRPWEGGEKAEWTLALTVSVK